jgi:hypothetical protein
LPANARRQDLLRAPGAHSQEFLDLRPIYPWVGEFLKMADDLVEAATPQWFIRHFRSKSRIPPLAAVLRTSEVRV